MGIESLIPALLKGGAEVLKAFFGMDKAAVTEVKRAETPVGLKPADADVLRDLGVRPVNRPANQD